MDYRIRRKSDGLFSSGGSVIRDNLKFTRRGKAWSNKSGLSNHLVLIETEKGHHSDRRRLAQTVYDGCEIVCQDLDGPAQVLSSVADYVKELNERRQ